VRLNITKTVEEAQNLLETDKQISPALKAMFKMLLMLVTILSSRLGLNSNNSSKPPSNDLNRKKTSKNSGKKPGGQMGRKGKNLEPIENPDHIIPIKLDKASLPPGDYHEIGYEARQVVEIEISRIVTEYQAQILEDAKGKRYIASFPKDVTRPIQYGQSIKAHAVYLSQFQLIPYERVADYFINEASIPISVGSLFNFNKEAFKLLEKFDEVVKQKLIQDLIVNADETGINVNGKRIWLHNACNEKWTYLYPHTKRGAEAMNEIGILPNFCGTLIHDHWKPYYTYKNCTHGLCNAHHVRELQWVIDNYPKYTWAETMQKLLLEINDAVNCTEKNCLDDNTANTYRVRYHQIIQIGEKETPLLLDPKLNKKKGHGKKSKERNLLERLRDFEQDTLLFMVDGNVPFTNNCGENDIRMAKVQQKISGCFKSIEGAKIFCRVRSYLLTAQKHDILPTDALRTLFAGRLPEHLFTG
jgi:transposase